MFIVFDSINFLPLAKEHSKLKYKENRNQTAQKTWWFNLSVKRNNRRLIRRITTEPALLFCSGAAHGLDKSYANEQSGKKVPGLEQEKRNV
ncbi:MAG: hypothetical protein WCP97_09490 [bacterium]